VNPSNLSTNQTFDNDLDVRIVGCQWQVLVDLRTAIAHPHQWNIAGNHPCRAIVQQFGRGLECIGEALMVMVIVRIITCACEMIACEMIACEMIACEMIACEMIDCRALDMCFGVPCGTCRIACQIQWHCKSRRSFG
jgi:hypothetical protein